MLKRLFNKFFRSSASATAALPSIDRSEIAHLLIQKEGLPQIDWGMADLWIRKREPSPLLQPRVRRAVVAAWLDELRDSTTADTRRWRKPLVEGLAPLEGHAGERLANWTDKSIDVITRALVPIRGKDPIDPIAVVGLGSADDYYSFISHFYSSGEFATSGGVYIRSDGDSFPLLAINGQFKSNLENTVAHELTHHALHRCRLPLWAEEGITQMMEERVGGHSNFTVTRDKLSRHRDLWLENDFEPFVDGSGFHSPEGDLQELSYHLAQLVVRSLLSVEPKRFFAFAQACATTPAEFAAKEHLGGSPADIARVILVGDSMKIDSPR